MFETKYAENETKKTIVVEQEFVGSVEQVWRAWTKSELLDKWWAPKPWVAKTKIMNFIEGGKWIFSMNGPDKQQSWSVTEFTSIHPISEFKSAVAFGDKFGNINTAMPTMKWHVRFMKRGNNTNVVTTITFPNQESMKQTLEMGFKEGFAMAHTNLDELLEK